MAQTNAQSLRAERCNQAIANVLDVARVPTATPARYSSHAVESDNGRRLLNKDHGVADPNRTLKHLIEFYQFRSNLQMNQVKERRSRVLRLTEGVDLMG